MNTPEFFIFIGIITGGVISLISFLIGWSCCEYIFTIKKSQTSLPHPPHKVSTEDTKETRPPTGPIQRPTAEDLEKKEKPIIAHEEEEWGTGIQDMMREGFLAIINHPNISKGGIWTASNL